MLEKIIEADRQLFLLLNNLGNEFWDPMWLLITDKWTAIPLYAFLLFLLYRNFSLKQLGVIIVLVALMIVCTDQLANIFKHGFERPRPCGQEGVRELARFIAVRCARFGYYSAHASNSMALAIFIGCLLKYKSKYILILLILWALVVSYSRIYIGVHYPLDVITGLFFGGILGYLFYLLERYFVRRFHII